MLTIVCMDVAVLTRGTVWQLYLKSVMSKRAFSRQWPPFKQRAQPMIATLVTEIYILPLNGQMFPRCLSVNKAKGWSFLEREAYWFKACLSQELVM